MLAETDPYILLHLLINWKEPKDLCYNFKIGGNRWQSETDWV